MFYNGEMVFEGRATCGNREGCPPVSLFDDGLRDTNWHDIELSVTPDGQGGAKMVFDLDRGVYGGYGLVSKGWPGRDGVPRRGYTLPPDAYLGFTGRTGGATNNHFVKGISMAVTRFTNADVTQFALSGSAILDDPNCPDGCLSLTQVVNSQSGPRTCRSVS